MKITILQPIAGLGDDVTGFKHEFHLAAGMTVDVKRDTAEKWIASGIAAPVVPIAETTSMAVPETAVLKRTTLAKKRKGPST